MFMKLANSYLRRQGFSELLRLCNGLPLPNLLTDVCSDVVLVKATSVCTPNLHMD